MVFVLYSTCLRYRLLHRGLDAVKDRWYFIRIRHRPSTYGVTVGGGKKVIDPIGEMR